MLICPRRQELIDVCHEQRPCLDGQWLGADVSSVDSVLFLPWHSLAFLLVSEMTRDEICWPKFGLRLGHRALSMTGVLGAYSVFFFWIFLFIVLRRFFISCSCLGINFPFKSRQAKKLHEYQPLVQNSNFIGYCTILSARFFNFCAQAALMSSRNVHTITMPRFGIN